ncbi:MAG: hypothetical protein IJY09_04465 [Lachnospiraceae bacterium]|nr:hypothetical protein [Lachnospiraceae bacterium]
MGNTHIVVLRKNQIVIALLAVVLLLLFAFFMTHGTKDNPATPASAKPAAYQPEAVYRAGVYTSAIALNDTILNLEVVVDTNHINSIRLVNLEESVTTMYPLIEPALESLASQLTNDVALDSVVISDTQKYTQLFLLEVIEQTLAKAAR